MISNLDDFPDPARDFLNTAKQNNHYAMPLILSSRGCPFNCSFCSSPAFFERKWRKRNYSRVVDEIQQIIHDYGFSHFYFTDDQILGRGGRDKGHLLAIAEEILLRNLHKSSDLYFFVMMRADFSSILTSPELNLIFSAGFKDIFVGFESGNSTQIAKYNKGIKIQSYFSTIRKCQKLFFLEGGFILFNPYTSISSLYDDAKLINALGIPQWSYYTKKYLPYPGSNLFTELATKDLLIESNYLLIDYNFLHRSVEIIYKTVSDIENIIAEKDYFIFLLMDALYKYKFNLVTSRNPSADSLFTQIENKLQKLSLLENIIFLGILEYVSQSLDSKYLIQQFVDQFNTLYFQISELIDQIQTAEFKRHLRNYNE